MSLSPHARLPLAARKAALALVQKLADSLMGKLRSRAANPLPRLMQQIE